MDPVTEVEQRAMFARDNDWRLVVRDLTLRLRVNSNKIQVVPNLFHELVKVPLILSADGDIMGESVKQVKLFNCNRVNLIENVDARNVNTVSFNDINQVIHRGVTFEIDITVGDSVLVKNGSNRVISHLFVLKSMGSRDINTTPILPLQSN